MTITKFNQFLTITKLKKLKLTYNCSNLRDEGDSTVILFSQEYTVREVRILNFYKVEVVQNEEFGRIENGIYENVQEISLSELEAKVSKLEK